MLLFSETIDSFTKHLTSLVKQILAEEIGVKVLKKRYRFTKYLKNGQLPRIWTEDFLKVHNCVVKSSAVIETELLKMIGGFRGIPKKSDYDCWLNVIKVEDLLYIDEPLFYYDGAHGSGQYY